MGYWDGKVVLGIGTGWGIGAGTMKMFARAGAKVVCAGTTLSRLENVVSEIRAEGLEGIAYQVDITNEAQVEAMMQAVVQKYGRIDVLFNNVTRNHIKPIKDLSIEEWNDVFAVTTTGPFLTCKHVFPIMQAQGGGNIVNTGSMAAFNADYNFCAYNSSKAALVNFTRCCALEFAPAHIRVNCVCPGLIDTPPIQAAFSDGKGGYDQEILGGVLARTPCGRLGQPEDIGNMVMFLADDTKAGYITGEIVRVNGGAPLVPSSPPRDSI